PRAIALAGCACLSAGISSPARRIGLSAGSASARPIASGSATARSCAAIEILSLWRGAEERIEPVEDDTALLDALSVVRTLCGDTGYDGVDSRGLEPVERVVLEIDVVDDLGDRSKGAVRSEPEAPHHRLERTVFAFMGELC